MAINDLKAKFLDTAVWHGSLEQAEAILKEHPEIAASDIHTEAVRLMLDLGFDIGSARSPAPVAKRRTPRGGASRILVYGELADRAGSAVGSEERLMQDSVGRSISVSGRTVGVDAK
jgi:hypothetical protein